MVDSVNFGANNWIYICDNGAGTTSGVQTDEVSVGSSAVDNGAMASIRSSYSYSTSDAPVYDQSNIAQSINVLDWWTNLNEKERQHF